MKRVNFLKSLGGLGFLSLIPNVILASPISNYINKLRSKIIKKNEGKVLNVIGDIQTHKLIGSETDNQIVEWVDNVEPGTGIPLHVHTKEDEIFRVIKGQIEISLNNETTVLEPGDTVFAPKNIPHSWKVVGKEKAIMITSAFPAGIEIMFSELSNLPPGPPDLKMVAEICGRHGITFIK